MVLPATPGGPIGRTALFVTFSKVASMMSRPRRLWLVGNVKEASLTPPSMVTEEGTWIPALLDFTATLVIEGAGLER